jgi:hypothetical protein
MQYILTEDEIINLVPKGKLKESEDNFKLVLKAYQSTEKCVPLYNCHECPLCSLNIKRSSICDKQELGK